METTLTGKVVTVQYIASVAGDDGMKTKLQYCTGILESIETEGGLGTVALDCKILPWESVESITLSTLNSSLSTEEAKIYGEQVAAQRMGRTEQSD